MLTTHPSPIWLYSLNFQSSSMISFTKYLRICKLFSKFLVTLLLPCHHLCKAQVEELRKSFFYNLLFFISLKRRRHTIFTSLSTFTFSGSHHLVCCRSNKSLLSKNSKNRYGILLSWKISKNPVKCNGRTQFD